MNKLSITKNNKKELRELYVDADKLLKNQRGNGKVACKAGCSACCTSFIWTHLEILYVLSFIKSSEFKKLKWLRKRIKKYDKIYNERLYPGSFESSDVNIAATFDDLPCIFLQNNKCIIYEHRPLTCRIAMSEISKGCVGLLKVPKEYNEKSKHLFNILRELNKEESVYTLRESAYAFPFRYIV